MRYNFFEVEPPLQGGPRLPPQCGMRRLDATGREPRHCKTYVDPAIPAFPGSRVRDPGDGDRQT